MGLTYGEYKDFVIFHLVQLGFDEFTAHHQIKSFRLREMIEFDRKKMFFPPKYWADVISNNENINYAEIQDLLI